jgi:GNAT superfamily N-acetyltransferase
MPQPDTESIVILQFGQIDPAMAVQGIDAIFWETTVRPPMLGADRGAFRELWLGQYLRHEPEHVHIAWDAATQRIAGYLVGCWDNPALSPRFASLSYFQTFAAACSRYPAHLHVNLTEPYRGRGIGGRLINVFAADTAAAGLPGMHVVTGGAARNVGFYTRLGFNRIASTARNDQETVFLGRDLKV